MSKALRSIDDRIDAGGSGTTQPSVRRPLPTYERKTVVFSGHRAEATAGIYLAWVP